MPPQISLPLSEEWTDPDAYVEALLLFATSSDLFRHLCGGVHVLDFMTREPDLYTSLLPEDWRFFFDKHDIQDIIDLLLREDLAPLLAAHQQENNVTGRQWRGQAFPPLSLLEYTHQIRHLSLCRDFTPQQPGTPSIPRRIAVGMKVKKYHEVAHFSRYVDSLCNTVSDKRGDEITHIVDFGSGQNYLGRTLASPPYNRHIVAIERKHHLVNGAKGMDIYANLAKKKVRLYNKKLENCMACEAPEAETETAGLISRQKPDMGNVDKGKVKSPTDEDDEGMTEINIFRGLSLAPDEIGVAPTRNGVVQKPAEPEGTRGMMDYIEHEIKDGYLEPIIKDVVALPAALEGHVETTDTNDKPADANVMVVSLHSCGNLLHHGVRALVLNPSVKAVAMIGCCYNLVTERLGPATYKLPILRTMHPRLSKDAVAFDPHGFPMSKRLENYEHTSGTGVKLNITARSMSLQAPYNWGRDDSDEFFTRHFYRALLQRVLVDRGIIPKPSIPKDLYNSDPSKLEEVKGSALVVGSLRKTAFASFATYTRAATAKLSRDPDLGEKITAGMAGLTDEDLERYITDFEPARKNLSVTWTLMSFSSSLVEAMIVIDRWQFLREHDSVRECWVEPVFEYSESPRNLAVIGIKK